MHNVIVDKPHKFVPPYHGRFWHSLIQLWLPRHLRRTHGIHQIECHGAEHLAASIAARHGILLAPNHCRPCDPMVLGMLSKQLGQAFFVMASWHLFAAGKCQKWLLRRAGAFSVYREGLDREALKAAIEILREARRPLVIFPEGVISRTNDRLGNLMDGTAFILRKAAKDRGAKYPGAKVVVHPIGIRYTFGGDIEATLKPVLTEIETRLSWRPQRHRSLIDRIGKIGEALLCLKEMEYFGRAQSGATPERLERLINFLLDPLEKRWLKGDHTGDVVARVKKLRMTILPDIIAGELSEEERSLRWLQLADLYLAQQLSFYPPDYIRSRPAPERLLETVERFEEDLTDRARIHFPIKAAIHVGEALDVKAARERGDRDGGDPLMHQLREQIELLLKQSAGV